ncbi:MAG: flagellar export chaperone FlgN [Phycisphaeraceae bacterium]
MDDRTQRLVNELESLLIDMIERQRLWLAVFEQKTTALRSADHNLMAALSSQENDHLQAMTEMEKRRLHLLADITQALDPQASEPLRLTALAQLLPETISQRLLDLRAELRTEIERFRSRLASVRQASESLLRHVNGVVTSVVAAATGNNVYSRSGSLPQPAKANLSTFSLSA